MRGSGPSTSGQHDLGMKQSRRGHASHGVDEGASSSNSKQLARRPYLYAQTPARLRAEQQAGRTPPGRASQLPPAALPASTAGVLPRSVPAVARQDPQPEATPPSTAATAPATEPQTTAPPPRRPMLQVLGFKTLDGDVDRSQRLSREARPLSADSSSCVPEPSCIARVCRQRGSLHREGSWHLRDHYGIFYGKSRGAAIRSPLQAIALTF